MKQIVILTLVLMLAACGGSSSSGPAVSNSPRGDGGDGAGVSDPGGGGNSDTDSGSGSDSGGSDQGGEDNIGLNLGPPEEGQVRPGVELVADGSSCTSNFLYYLNEQTVYIGAAAHCFSPDANSGLDSCETSNLPVGTAVTIGNATQPGSLAYSSWSAMQQVGEEPGNAACVHNDFALVQIHPDDLGNIHPAVIGFGGPTALRTDLAEVGETVYAYGQSMLHLGVQELQTRRGEIIGLEGGDWLYDVSNDLPGLGVPGDSGGPVMDAQGRALGVTAVLTVRVPPSVSNGVVNLDRALNYAKSNGFINPAVRVITWSDFNVDAAALALPLPLP